MTTTSVTVQLPAANRTPEEARTLALRLLAHFAIRIWTAKMAVSSNEKDHQQSLYCENPESALHMRNCFMSKVRRLAISIGLIIVLCSYLILSDWNQMDESTTINRIGFCTISIMISSFVTYLFASNMKGVWKGFTVFRVAKFWKQKRVELEKVGVVEAIITSLRFGHQYEEALKRYDYNSCKEALNADLAELLKVHAEKVLEHEIHDRPLDKRAAKKKFKAVWDFGKEAGLSGKFKSKTEYFRTN